MANETFVVNVRNVDGSPKIEREMTSQEWKEYLKCMESLKEIMREEVRNLDKYECEYYYSRRTVITCIPLQKESEFEHIPYHAVGNESGKTIATSGSFPLVTKSILESFGIKVELEDLIRIAEYGDWIERKVGGTYWHFIDSVCSAYGLNVMRIATFDQMINVLKSKGVVAALLSHKLFPNGTGRHLAIVYLLHGEVVTLISPSTRGYEYVTGEEFLKNCDALWAITEP